MANIHPDKTVDRDLKFHLMQEDARFDISSSIEICAPEVLAVREEIRARKAAPKVPKIFLSNECVFNCAYCQCRSGNECKQAYQTSPRELADFSVKVAAASHTGIFLSSAIYKSASYTGELIAETLRIIREEHRYTGYLHAKVMPGTDLELIRRAGRFADRLSVNIEVAKSEGYSKIAMQKNKGNILTPMGHISRLIGEAKGERRRRKPAFATSQTTQLMVGSTDEDDFTILNLAGALYKKYDLSRVYYTPFSLKEAARGYDGLPLAETPGWRVARLYQADKLIKEYGFLAEEIAPAASRNLRQDLDPKAAWALRNLHLFPIEVNGADFDLLLRIPGIGVTYAKRILEARRYTAITHEVLKKIGVSLKRSEHFLTCNGRYTGCAWDGESVLYHYLAAEEQRGGNQLYFDMGQVARVKARRPLHA